MVKIENINIFNSPVEIIIHQANCFCTMGSGIASEIRKRYPRAYKSDVLTEKGSRKKLGQFSFAEQANDQDRTIINLYSQYNYGREKRLYTDYKSMETGLQNIHDFIIKMEWQNKIVGIPFNMGCGYGGGSWKEVESIIRKIFEKSIVQVLICKI